MRCRHRALICPQPGEPCCARSTISCFVPAVVSPSVLDAQKGNRLGSGAGHLASAREHRRIHPARVPKDGNVRGAVATLAAASTDDDALLERLASNSRGRRDSRRRSLPSAGGLRSVVAGARLRTADTGQRVIPGGGMACMDCVPGSVACSLAPPDATLEHPVTTTLKKSTSCGNSMLNSKKFILDETKPRQRKASLQLKFPHSCRECFNDCIAKLVSLADVQEKMTFGQALLRQHKEGKLKKITETTDSETFLATTGSKQQQQYATSDTVVQLYYIDTHSASRVYANLFTCKRLSDLHAGIHNKSFGFRLIRRILFIEDKMPDNFVKAYDEFATTRARSFHPHP
ncbi:hypothetical protein HPB47_010153, partial [Ixodes persulcatus]